VHVEVVGEDAEALQGFYRNAFDWQMQPSGPDYAMAHPGVEGCIDGGVGASPEGGQGHVTFYVESLTSRRRWARSRVSVGAGWWSLWTCRTARASRCSPTPRAILWASSRPDLDVAEARGRTERG
jgi:hypothetical protein